MEAVPVGDWKRQNRHLKPFFLFVLVDAQRSSKLQTGKALKFHCCGSPKTLIRRRVAPLFVLELGPPAVRAPLPRGARPDTWAIRENASEAPSPNVPSFASSSRC